MSEEDKKSVENTESYEAPARQSAPAWLPWVGGGAVVVVLLIASYLVGMQVGKGGSTASTRDGFGSMMRGYGNSDDSSNTGMPSGDFRGGRGMMGTSGTVTAISSTSITVKDTMRGGLVTYTINSSTTVKSGTTTKAISDVTTGTTVRVQASTSDTTVASTITIETDTTDSTSNNT